MLTFLIHNCFSTRYNMNCKTNLKVVYATSYSCIGLEALRIQLCQPNISHLLNATKQTDKKIRVD